MELTLYGHSGFVGTAFMGACEPGDSLWLAPRWSRRPNPYKTTDMVYFISTTHNYHVFDDPTEDVRTNLLVLTETLDSWKRNNPEGVFNFISSWFVCGPRNGFERAGKTQEDETCRPQGFYSITKYCAEQLIESFCRTHGMKYRILRLCNILGPGDMGVSKQKNALQYLINEMKADRPIEIYGDGNFTRNYMDVRDCARAIRLVVEKGHTNAIYNIGTEPSQRFIDLINLAYHSMESKSEIKFIPAKKFHKQVQVENFDMDCGRLRALGFEPEYNIVQTVMRLLK